MVRHVRDRPVAMQAFPNGIGGDGHYMKDRPKHFPDWIPDVRVAKRGGSLRHILIRETSALVYLAGQNVITPHVWTSRADDVRKPDRIVFDLDPSTQKFAEVRAAARATGELLGDLGLAPHAMVTGSRGIHVTVPIKRRAVRGGVRVREGGRHAARRRAPEEADDRVPQGEARRPHLRGRAAQQVRAARGPAVRGPAAPEAPVAAPLHWDELDDARLKPDRWTIASMPKRLEEQDAWHGIGGRARRSVRRYEPPGLASRRCAGRSARPGPPGGSGSRPG